MKLLDKWDQMKPLALHILPALPRIEMLIEHDQRRCCSGRSAGRDRAQEKFLE